MNLLPRDPEAPGTWQGSLPVASRYTYGLAGERFFRALRDEGVILGSRCGRCGITYVPARQFCERCFDELQDWYDVGTRGEVHAFTRLHTNLDGSPLVEPELIAFVRIADGGIMHRLGEVDPEMIEIGMAVEAVLKPASERKGSILDIEHFRPTKA